MPGRHSLAKVIPMPAPGYATGEERMKLVGLLIAVAGGLLSIIGLTLTSSSGVRPVLCLAGFSLVLTGIKYIWSQSLQAQSIGKR
jgi:hypothetical protein